MNAMTPPTAHPDWTALIAARNSGGDDPAGWADALDHMDACEPCRRQALGLDPLLVFRRLGPADAVETAPAEAESMKAAVAAMRRARRVEPAGTPAPTSSLSSLRPSTGTWTSWRRIAAAAVLVASLAGGSTLLLDPFSSDGTSGPAGSSTATTSAVVPLAPGAPAATRQEAPPLVENLDRPDADVVQLGGEEMAVVMIFDAGLDV